MKNLLILGDSIRRGYDKSVKKSLEGKANVFFPEENTRFAAYLLRHFHDYLKEIKAENVDVIHWNAGLWDCLRFFGEEPQSPIEIYSYYIDRVCARMKNLCPNAKIIFATSTSVITERMNPYARRYNYEIEEYNAAAIEVVKKYGIEVNDLYAVSQSLPEEAHSDATHYYTPMGTEAFTNQVLSYVVPALGINEEIKYCEDLHTDKPFGI